MPRGGGRRPGARQTADAGTASVASESSRTISTMSLFAFQTRSCRSAPLPRARISRTPSSSRSEPSSRACGSTSRSVRRISCDDRHPVAAAGGEIHHRRLEAVARGEPLVLGGQDPVPGRNLASRLVVLAVHLRDRLEERRDRDDVLEPRDGVAHAQLDRAEARMRADVPPDVRVVGDAAGALELADDLGEVRVVLEPRRRAGARERGEDHLPARREAGRLAAPERRVRRQREQLGEVDEQAVHHLDRLLGVVDRDVDVHAEDQLAAGDVLQLVDELAVAVARGDPLPLEEAERMRAGRRRSGSPRSARSRRRTSRSWRQGVQHVVGGAADRRRHLEHRLHQLGGDVILQLAVLDRREHRVDVLHEIPRLGVEQHVLLLDAERVRIALAERVVEHARARTRGAGALAGDRRREDLLHLLSIRHQSTIASASISTSQRGSSSSATIPVVAGRAVANASPCARPTSSISAASVT